MSEIIRQNAWLTLLMLGIVMLLGGLMSNSSTVDIQLHDTFFVINKTLIGVLVGGLFLIQALVYKWVYVDSLNHWLSNIHLVGALVFSLILLLFVFTSSANVYFNEITKVLSLVFFKIVILVVFCINVIQTVLK